MSNWDTCYDLCGQTSQFHIYLPFPFRFKQSEGPATVKHCEGSLIALLQTLCFTTWQLRLGQPRLLLNLIITLDGMQNLLHKLIDITFQISVAVVWYDGKEVWSCFESRVVDGDSTSASLNHRRACPSHWSRLRSCAAAAAPPCPNSRSTRTACRRYKACHIWNQGV